MRCGSDLHEYVAGPVFIPVEAPHPLTGIKGQCILGHEFCGEIVKLAEIRALTQGLGADVSFECIGNKHTAKLAIDAIRKAGTCVLVGIFEEPSSFNFFELVATEKQVLGALAYNGEFADVIAFIADGRLDITPLVTGRIELEKIVEKGFEELVHNKEHNVKIIVSPRAA